MSIKKSVMIHSTTLAVMNAMTDKRSNDENSPQWSSLVNRAVIVNDFLFRASMPDLSINDWQVILNCYAGTVGSLEHPPFRISSDLMDDRGLIDIDLHPDKDLVKRVHVMSQCEQFAILSFVERYWNNNWDHAKDFEDVIDIILSKPELD